MMRTKYALFALALGALTLQPDSGWAVSNRESDVRWEGAIEPQASRLILFNLSARPAEAAIGSAVVPVSADGVAEIPAAGLGSDQLRLRSEAHLLVVQAPEGFDAGSLEIERQAAGQSRGSAWVKGLVAGESSVRHGATGAVQVQSDDAGALVEVAVELLAPHSVVRIRQLDAMGNEVSFLVASASRPLRWRAFLGPVGGESRIELQTLRGEARGTAAAVIEGASSPARRLPIGAIVKAGGGSAKYDPPINWEKNPTLHYRISSAPPSVCGDLWVTRNGGPWTVTPGWVCTDASGSATKGPWFWANQNGSEIADAYIVWSNGLSTNTDRHIWDKDRPSARITSPGGLPAPTSFFGTASDRDFNDFNAGFSTSWKSFCKVTLKNLTTGRYWCPGLTGYDSSGPCSTNNNCALTYPFGNPSLVVYWDAIQIPPGYAHFSTHCYEWRVNVYQASQVNPSLSDFNGQASRTFCVP